MLKPILSEIFERDLIKLKTEIELYTDSADMWIAGGDIINSAGNLTLHIIGNLNHYIGEVLGRTGYIRDRVNEFASAEVPRAELISSIDETRDIVERVIRSMDEEIFGQNYPIEVLDGTPTTGFFLIHLAVHLNYHLGQINYHRRLLAKGFKGEQG